MILDFKKQVFCQLSGVSPKQVDPNDPIWADRIDQLLSTRNILPSPGDPSEYAAAFEAVYPSEEERRRYIARAVQKGTPSFAHRGLAALITQGSVPCVFTTNFDSMVETAAIVANQLLEADQRADLTVAAIDNADRATLCLKESRWPLLAKIHGDYQSVALKNTDAELAEQDQQMRLVLEGSCSRFGLIVIGYSGRDQSVMTALSDALRMPAAFPGGIVWTCRSAQRLIPQVIKFLNSADEAGVSVTIAETANFDELVADLLDGKDLPPVLNTHVYETRPAVINKLVPLPSQEIRQFPVLQSSALQILEMPKHARKITLERSLTTPEARKLLKLARRSGVVSSLGKEIAVFGRDVDFLEAWRDFGPSLSGTINLEIDNNSWAKGLVYDALTTAICADKPLHPRLSNRGHAVVFAHGNAKEDPYKKRRRIEAQSAAKSAYGTALTGMVPNKPGFFFNEGARIKLERVVDRWWCVFDPTTFVKRPAAKDATARRSQDAAIADWTRERWANRYNQFWANIITAWVPLIAGTDYDGHLHAYRLSDGEGVDASFQLSPVTAWSRPAHEHEYFRRP